MDREASLFVDVWESVCFTDIVKLLKLKIQYEWITVFVYEIRNETKKKRTYTNRK